ncbi:MAG: metallophosphoesterase [Gammaproteobacteria bacterium]|nr:metallophosphoesterase [Gammaproteobacteria bacterium]
MTPTQDGITILQVTDTHLSPEAETTLHGVCTFQSLTAVLDQAFSEAVPDAVVVTGDIANVGSLATYELFRDAVGSRYAGPMLCVPGNHDLSAPFRSVLPTTGLEFDAWKVIGVDTHVDNCVGGHLEADECKRLSNALESCSKQVLVVGHHPPFPIRTPWLDKQCIDNGERLVAMLRGSGKVSGYAYGHVHQEFGTVAGDVQLLASPSTCYQFEPGSDRFSIDGCKPGYRWIHLNDDRSIDSEVRRLDDFELTVELTDTKY